MFFSTAVSAVPGFRMRFCELLDETAGIVANRQSTALVKAMAAAHRSHDDVGKPNPQKHGLKVCTLQTLPECAAPLYDSCGKVARI